MTVTMIDPAQGLHPSAPIYKYKYYTGRQAGKRCFLSFLSCTSILYIAGSSLEPALPRPPRRAGPQPSFLRYFIRFLFDDSPAADWASLPPVRPPFSSPAAAAAAAGEASTDAPSGDK
mmetsp:Transcript_5668/g.14636  ORF Transcript_5668/g.14636 Transcript_5668/m.14636 type:complete len:118 (-) Transcript_5668:1039-1392(-)